MFLFFPAEKGQPSSPTLVPVAPGLLSEKAHFLQQGFKCGWAAGPVGSERMGEQGAVKDGDLHILPVSSGSQGIT